MIILIFFSKCASYPILFLSRKKKIPGSFSAILMRRFSSIIPMGPNPDANPDPPPIVVFFPTPWPQCPNLVLSQPSTEDRVEAMRTGHERVYGLTLEEDEERLMRIAIRESAAESRRGMMWCGVVWLAWCGVVWRYGGKEWNGMERNGMEWDGLYCMDRYSGVGGRVLGKYDAVRLQESEPNLTEGREHKRRRQRRRNTL